MGNTYMKADTALALGVAVLQPVVARTQGDLQAKVRAAMQATLQGEIWWTTDREELFKYAVGATLSHYGPGTPEWERLEHEMHGLRLLAAGIVAQNLDAVMAHMEQPGAPEIVGLRKLWDEVEEAEGRT